MTKRGPSATMLRTLSVMTQITSIILSERTLSPVISKSIQTIRLILRGGGTLARSTNLNLKRNYANKIFIKTNDYVY